MRYSNVSFKLVLVGILINVWYDFIVFVFVIEIVFNYFECFFVDFFIVVILKEFNFV